MKACRSAVSAIPGQGIETVVTVVGCNSQPTLPFDSVINP